VQLGLSTATYRTNSGTFGRESLLMYFAGHYAISRLVMREDVVAGARNRLILATLGLTDFADADTGRGYLFD
jgi:hypothetical protein